MTSERPTIILGVSGSIAAYKAPLVVRGLIKSGAELRVVMTPSATEFVTPLVLANLSRHAVAVDMFDENVQRGGSWHIDLARQARAMVIAPASAKTIAALAHGITDTPVSCVALALPDTVPLFIAPAMDTEMWEHPVTRHNLGILRARGVHVLGPASGELASGSVGMGRMQEPEEIVESLRRSVDGFTSSVASTIEPQVDEEIDEEIDEENDTDIEADIHAQERIASAAQRPTSSLQDSLDHDAWSVDYMLAHMKGRARSAT
ncbi:MAG: flavoprotein, partial [Candidatus Kapaibacterium sp.]